MARLEIRLDLLRENCKFVFDLCKKRNIECVGVTKLFDSCDPIVGVFYDAGIKKIADISRANIPSEFPNLYTVLLSITPSQAALTDVPMSDEVYISSFTAAKALSKAAVLMNKEVKVMISLEAGDLRDGLYPQEVCDLAFKIKDLPNLQFTGFGANLGCLRGRVFDSAVKEKYVQTYDCLKKYGLQAKDVSIGGTVVWDSLVDGTLPACVNQIRIGEAIFFGYNTSMKSKINELNPEGLSFYGEILENKKKNTSEIGKIAYNAEGLVSNQNLSGIRRRIVCDFGELDAPGEHLLSKDEGILFSGSSHNHTVYDVEDSDLDLCPGDEVCFAMDYHSAAFAIHSKNVSKKYIDKAI